MKNVSEIKKSVAEWIANNKKPFEELALALWNNPEIAWEEREAARLQMKFLEKRGFRVTQKGDLPTAFMAETGQGGPVVGLLGEYDALAGLSQRVSAKPDPVVAGAPGHGCGHNLLGVGTMLAACAVGEALAAAGLPGRVRYYGCPAEEQLTGKGKMAQCGYFEGTDVSLAWHPGDHSSVSDATMTALVSAKFAFKGRSAHAGASPEAGRSALDALELMNVGANYLREHMVGQDRLHYVTTNGGLAPNIVPSSAEVWYYARAPHDGELAALWRRLVKVAKGAAMMTETEVGFQIIGGCYNTLANPTLSALLDDNLRSFAGAIEVDAEERAFARELQATLPEGQVEASLAAMPPLANGETVLATEPMPCFDKGRFIMASSDVGDVANLMPTSFLLATTWPVGVPAHSWQSTACAGSTLGLKGAIQAGTTLAGTVCDLAADPALVEKAKAEFANQRKGKRYVPIEELLKSGEA